MHREYSPPEETVLSPSPLHNTKAEMKSSEAEGTDEERRLPGPTPLPVFSPMTSETVGSSRGNGLLCLKWNNFEKHIVQSFTSIFQTEELTDVTLVPDTGEPIKAHKIILALSSPYFRKIFQENPCKHPIVVLQGLKFEEVHQVIEFIYTGQVRVRENDFEDFMEAAESLRIDGLISQTPNMSDDPDSPGAPSQQGSSPRSLEDSQPLPWMSMSESGKSGGPPHAESSDTWSAENSLSRSVGLKRSSASSGISSIYEHKQPRTSIPSSSPVLPQENPFEREIVRERATESGTNEPVLIQIDNDQSRGGRERQHPQSQPRSQQCIIDFSLNRSRTQNDLGVAEDLRKSTKIRAGSPKSPYELSIRENAPFSSGSRSAISTPPIFSNPHSKRSTSWPLASPSHPKGQSPPNSIFSHVPGKSHHPATILRYLPFLPPSPAALPRPIPHHPFHFHHNIPPNVTQVTNTFNFSHGRSLPSPTFPGSTSRKESSHTTLLRASSPHLIGETEFFNSNRELVVSKYEIGLDSSSSSPKFTKPKTKAIRSSQVPQSARYTASQVDAMVEKVENFPGPLVPCIVCQKFVKRERLRAHIHECHLLPEEKIECPICKIGLKSKGSYRVHLWRHRRAKPYTETKPDDTRRDPDSNSV